MSFSQLRFIKKDVDGNTVLACDNQVSQRAFQLYRAWNVVWDELESRKKFLPPKLYELYTRYIILVAWNQGFFGDDRVEEERGIPVRDDCTPAQARLFQCRQARAE